MPHWRLTSKGSLFLGYIVFLRPSTFYPHPRPINLDPRHSTISQTLLLQQIASCVQSNDKSYTLIAATSHTLITATNRLLWTNIRCEPTFGDIVVNRCEPTFGDKISAKILLFTRWNLLLWGVAAISRLVFSGLKELIVSLRELWISSNKKLKNLQQYDTTGNFKHWSGNCFTLFY